MKRLSRPYWTLTLLIALSAALGATVLRAAAQSLMAPPLAQAPPAQTPPDRAPAPPSKSAPPPATPAGAIRDDPTVAPDKGQSADNNVSFPVDI